MIHPDREEYATSIAKVGIVLAWFQLHSEPSDAQTRHELGLANISSNDIKFVKGMERLDVQILREWESRENWLHDSASLAAPSRRRSSSGRESRTERR